MECERPVMATPPILQIINIYQTIIPYCLSCVIIKVTKASHLHLKIELMGILYTHSKQLTDHEDQGLKLLVNAFLLVNCDFQSALRNQTTKASK